MPSWPVPRQRRSGVSVVCVTPVKNEEWILSRFLDCAAHWADQIIVLDQCSTDRSREIASAHPRVRLLVNDDETYDEVGRQRVLLNAAREIPGKRLIIALDADEVLSADTLRCPAWMAALRAEPGTVVRLRWANLLPGCEQAWIPPEPIAFGFVDDGREHQGTALHSARLPGGDDGPSIMLEDQVVLHYQYAIWGRMKSKQRWYQCWERLHHPTKRPIQLYRQYHFMDALPRPRLRPAEPAWFEAYEAQGVDMKSATEQPWYHWDEDVLDWLITYGTERFSKLDIWEPDYVALAQQLGRPTANLPRKDPRTASTRMIHAWLARTQHRSHARAIRLGQRALIPLGW